jgi:hypothetical protein
LDAGGDGVLRWWVQGDAAPTGPESGTGGGGGGESDGSDGSGGSFPPCPAATRPATWSVDGAANGKFGGGTLWNPKASKGPKLVLASNHNGKVASEVTAWGGGVKLSAKRWKDPEQGNRQRWYFPRSLPSAMTLRVHVPGGTDFVLTVPDTSARWD